MQKDDAELMHKDWSRMEGQALKVCLSLKSLLGKEWECCWNPDHKELKSSRVISSSQHPAAGSRACQTAPSSFLTELQRAEC